MALYKLRLFYFAEQIKNSTFVEFKGGRRLWLPFLFSMIDKDLVKTVVKKELENTSLYLIEVSVRPGNKIVVEIDSDLGVGIDDCMKVSRQIESHLDRDIEDFELEVGSSGLTTPFKIPRQYEKNIGNEVEVLSGDGRKLHGILKSCNDLGFTLTIRKKEKVEGQKRPVDIEKDENFLYEEVKYTKYQISIK